MSRIIVILMVIVMITTFAFAKPRYLNGREYEEIGGGMAPN